MARCYPLPPCVCCLLCSSVLVPIILNVCRLLPQTVN